jgi:Family of unknown function (DUF5372)
MHPLYGQTLAVRTVRRVGDVVEVMVAHPDGRVRTLPGGATDLTPPRPPRRVGEPLPRVDPTQVVTLLHRVAALVEPVASPTPTRLDRIAPPAASLPPLPAAPACPAGPPRACTAAEAATGHHRTLTSQPETPDVAPPRTTRRPRPGARRPEGPAHPPHRSAGRPPEPPDPPGPAPHSGGRACAGSPRMVCLLKMRRALDRRLTMLSPRRPPHLQRHASVSLRQSTPGQVDTPRARTARP